VINEFRKEDLLIIVEKEGNETFLKLNLEKSK